MSFSEGPKQVVTGDGKGSARLEREPSYTVDYRIVWENKGQSIQRIVARCRKQSVANAIAIACRKYGRGRVHIVSSGPSRMVDYWWIS